MKRNRAEKKLERIENRFHYKIREKRSGILNNEKMSGKETEERMREFSIFFNGKRKKQLKIETKQMKNRKTRKVKKIKRNESKRRNKGRLYKGC